MATRKPIVLVSGLLSEVPVGDITVELAASPSGLIYVGSKLGIDGSAQISGNAALTSASLKLPLTGGVLTGVLAVTAGTAALPSVTPSGDPDTGIFSPGANQVAISTNGVGRLFVDSAGNVGVGNTAPQALLHVSGTNAFALFTNSNTGSTATDGLQVGLGGGGSTEAYIIQQENNNLHLYNAGATAATIFSTNSTERVRIRSDGMFEVKGAGTAGSSPAFSVNGSAPANSAVIDSSGRLGIGTSSPGYKLDVTGPGTANGVTLNLSDVASNADSRHIQLTRSTSTAFLGIAGSAANDPFFISRSGTNSDFIINSTGKVGIGTTSPTQLLDVVDNSDASIGLRIRNNSTGSSAQSILTFSAAGRDVSYSVSYAGQFASESGSSITSKFTNFDTHIWRSNAGSERARIDSSGRLLVGTSTARSNFFNSTVTTGLQLEGTTDNQGRSISVVSSSATTSHGGQIFLAHQKSGAVGGNTTLANGDRIGLVSFQGSDGTNFIEGARVSAEVDGGVSTGDLPSRLVFSVTGDGSASPTEAMRIDSVGRVRPSVTTLASYIYNNWTPSDVSGTVTNAPNTGTVSDSEFVTLANASGTLTITFDIAGKYLVGTRAQTNHSNTYTSDRLTLTFGGTASSLPPNASNSGDSVNDFDFTIGNSYLVSATAGQTFTVLPTYECIGAGSTANHTALCGITVLYCGG